MQRGTTVRAGYVESGIVRTHARAMPEARFRAVAHAPCRLGFRVLVRHVLHVVRSTGPGGCRADPRGANQPPRGSRHRPRVDEGPTMPKSKKPAANKPAPKAAPKASPKKGGNARAKK